MTKILLRLTAACAALCAVTGCSAPNCEEAIPGSMMGPGVCHLPGGPDAGPKSSTGSGGDWTADRYVDAGRMPAMSMQMAGEMDEPDRISTMPKCGNGVFELGEICDGNCPTECDTGNACFKGTLTGSPATCDAKCVLREMDQCRSGDGCCPAGCTDTLDSDCSATCGDGVVMMPETCEAGSAKPCPDSCDDGNACTVDMLSGTPEQCNVMCGHMPVAADAKTKDGCCPPGANITVDADCEPKCGDGVVSAPETCDTASAKGCPTTCDDMDSCTVDSLSGSADKCNVSCSRKAITAKVNGDGCCPSGATEAEDSDCKIECYETMDCPNNPNECLQVQCAANKCTTKALTRTCESGTGQCQPDGSCKIGPMCGNGKVESGEKCDGNCAPCDDGNACTKDTSTGSANTCDLTCKHESVAKGGACGSGMRCDGAGKCVAPTCGDGVVDDGEKCDGNCPTSCPKNANECRNNMVVASSGACSAECVDAVWTAGTVCGDGYGACDGWEAECVKNSWYDSCSSTGGGCGNALKCRPINNYCTNNCVGDSQCGKSADGKAGKCLQGWCNHVCANDGECDEGQKCLEFDIGKVCRPKPCGASAGDDSDKDCPLGLRCDQDGGPIWQCVP